MAQQQHNATMDEPVYDDEARVLVAVVSRPRDLERVRQEHWYRIPVARAPAQIAAEYLALYQTGAFGAERWAVRYYAPILSYRVLLRAELLPEEADHVRANQQYYRIEVGALRQLPVAIPAGRLRRITFISTTMSQLQQARDVTELWVPQQAHAAEEVWGAGIAGRSLG
jgi:hypothetical protein